MIYEGFPSPEFGGRVAIIVAKFNRTITERLLIGALEKFEELGMDKDQIDIYYVPGAFEIPTVAAELCEDDSCVGILALGAVIRGETSHDEHINRAISLQFAELSVDYGKPLMFGVLTCNTVEQALARSGGTETGSHDKAQDAHLGNKGADCAEGLLEMIHLLAQMRN